MVVNTVTTLKRGNVLISQNRRAPMHHCCLALTPQFNLLVEGLDRGKE